MVVLRRAGSSDDLLSAANRPTPDFGPRLTRSRSLPSILGSLQRVPCSGLKLFARLFDPHGHHRRKTLLLDRPKTQVIVLGSGGKGPKKEKEKEKAKGKGKVKDGRKRWSSWLPDHERRWPIQGW